jgi:hypothetical protein
MRSFHPDSFQCFVLDWSRVCMLPLSDVSTFAIKSDYFLQNYRCNQKIAYCLRKLLFTLHKPLDGAPFRVPIKQIRAISEVTFLIPWWLALRKFYVIITHFQLSDVKAERWDKYG